MALEENGYAIVSNIYSDREISQMLSCIENVNQTGNSFLKTKELFAIRQLIKKIPALTKMVFNKKLTELISYLSESNYFLTKAIYFDKPKASNWFVGYHKDISISVDKKETVESYKNWTLKKGQNGVQPPIKILQDTITIRIHLDDTDENNGALKVIPTSHLIRFVIKKFV
ncbi:phytanoyl-CoA dioxygenase family protein [Aquimarina sp. RZ0]|uniref:phytanoyl-CoA dioxygenase family protein n=1 Tax=Aquimarina sp. RZ0 TaxID=2607730 RepID=UPI002104AF16|nr:phytanoyl-CoA dioxygenase family protein [Aquimarina sp. RZ0]